MKRSNGLTCMYCTQKSLEQTSSCLERKQKQQQKRKSTTTTVDVLWNIRMNLYDFVDHSRWSILVQRRYPSIRKRLHTWNESSRNHRTGIYWQFSGKCFSYFKTVNPNILAKGISEKTKAENGPSPQKVENQIIGRKSFAHDKVHENHKTLSMREMSFEMSKIGVTTRKMCVKANFIVQYSRFAGFV